MKLHYANDLSLTNIAVDETVDEKTINQNIENILMTNRGERLFNLGFGCGLRHMLFSAMTTGFTDNLREEILSSLKLWEPRISVDMNSSQFIGDPEHHTVLIKIPYTIRITGQRGMFSRGVML